MTAEALQRTLERIGTTRDARFDPIGLSHVQRLLERARTLPEPARERLVARAEAELVAFEERASRARASAAERIEALESRGFEVGGLRTRLAEGDYVSVRRAHDHLLARPLSERGALRDRLRARLRNALSEHGIDGDADATTGVATLGLRLYQHTATDIATDRVLARAVDAVPNDAGRYHAESVAAHVLRAFKGYSPAYLRASLARLDALAAVHRFVASFDVVEAREADEAKAKSKKAKKSAVKKKR